MFLQTNNFMPLQSSLTHKHTSNNLPFDSEKENRKVVQTKRQPQLQHPYSESEPHSHHQRPNIMAPMSEYTHNHSATANAPGPTYDYSSMFSGIMTKDGNNSLKNFDSCHHSCKEKFKRSFCKECGIFIPKVRIFRRKGLIFMDRVEHKCIEKIVIKAN